MSLVLIYFKTEIERAQSLYPIPDGHVASCDKK